MQRPNREAPSDPPAWLLPTRAGDDWLGRDESLSLRSFHRPAPSSTGGCASAGVGTQGQEGGGGSGLGEQRIEKTIEDGRAGVCLGSMTNSWLLVSTVAEEAGVGRVWHYARAPAVADQRPQNVKLVEVITLSAMGACSMRDLAAGFVVGLAISWTPPPPPPPPPSFFCHRRGAKGNKRPSPGLGSACVPWAPYLGLAYVPPVSVPPQNGAFIEHDMDHRGGWR
ncbi:hypothetical protein GGTG_10843 [Gaeumannomyces tritici R3-111a-1]|uniref:Uncharacterized protein n=1 Tax=Gaeumannomyces tritici (strain R3-111a-1) TaxID=644352 RepID=J3PBH1_GAET3|nr:hypothetical protein GGTG_10843 [Gaeumannomyces tritici R3-111a-1]EJT71588.1 hypothetical protein GGTG_10843 [Gaeumannomyces tritici R3-111a-1]